MAAALQGIKVIDLSRVVAGPMCAMILGDLGADVLKVEHPAGGDEVRSWGPPYAGRDSAYYTAMNRNKRSITVDFKTPEGREIIRQLLQDADVVIENFKTGDLERFGLGYEQVREYNPGLIYCSISGYGRTGPDREKPGYDFAIQGRGGYMSITGDPDGPPMKVGLPIIDVLAALNAAVGILAALRVRDCTGFGQWLDISLLDSEVAALVNQGSNWLVGGEIPRRWGNANPNVVPYQTFRAQDGWFNIAVGNTEQFRRLCQALGMPDVGEDPRFATNALRVKNRDELIEVLQTKLLEKPVAHWVRILTDFGVPADPIQDIRQVFEDDQVLARGMLVTLPHPTLGEVRVAGSALKLSETPVTYRRHPPLLGEHTDEVLEGLGYSLEQRRVLRRKGVI